MLNGKWTGKMMRVLPVLMIAVMLMSACGGTAATPTTAPTTAATAMVTEPTAMATEAATAAATAMVDASPTAMTGETPTVMAEASPTAAPPPFSKAGTLTIWADERRVPVIEKAAADFTAKSGIPVAVQQVGFGDIRDQLKLAGPAKEGPDIIVGAHDWLGELVSNGLVDSIELGDATSKIDPVGVKAFTYEGKTYGLPYALEAIALMYNKDLVPTPPATWDELKAIAKKLKDEGKVDQGYVLQEGDPFHTYPIVTGFGGYVFKQNPDGTYDPTDVGLDSPGGKAAMKEIDQMVKDGLLRKDVTGAIQESLFKEGKSAMWLTGPWNIEPMTKAGVNFGVAKIPTMAGEARPFVGVQGFMVSSFGKNKDSAKSFLLDYMATDAAMKAMFDADPRIPAWASTQAQVTDVNVKAFMESASTGQPMPAIPQMSAVWDDWTKAIKIVFQQQQDPEAAITDAANSIRSKIK
ncbi:MAG TPA: maltose ABC transporter substrate-binding protein [Chloroflexia bacterium]|nr:maltose ABC transporter substrate-binding protein [Chloroflexia bacterium]